MGASTFIRIPRLRPSVFRTPEDKDFIEACINNFRPRDSESGTSLWKLPCDDFWRSRVLASFAARRPSRQPMDYLELEREWFSEAGLEIKGIPDDTGFDCIAEYHYELITHDDGLTKLAQRLQQELISTPSILHRIQKSELPEMIISAARDCEEEVLTQTRAWVQKILH